MCKNSEKIFGDELDDISSIEIKKIKKTFKIFLFIFISILILSFLVFRVVNSVEVIIDDPVLSKISSSDIVNYNDYKKSSINESGEIVQQIGLMDQLQKIAHHPIPSFFISWSTAGL